MNNKKLIQIYFSPTGSTKKVIKISDDVWNQYESKDIDLCENIESIDLVDDGIAIIAVPSYGGRVPSIAVERLKKIKANHMRAIIITSYGNREFDNTLDELNYICSKQGFSVIGAIAAVCEHSIMHQYATNRPDNKDLQEIEEYMQLIKVELEENNLKELTYRDASVWREYHGVSLKPKTSKQCNSCGLCAKKCPVSAIDYSNPKITNDSKCISCMRCISICPNQARSLDPLMVAEVAKKMKKVCSIRKENQLFTNKL